MADTPNSPAQRSGCLFSLKMAAVFYLLVTILAFCILLFAGAPVDNAIAMSIIWPYYLPLLIVMGFAAKG